VGLVLGVALTSASAARPGGCNRCDGEGLLPCGRHARADADAESRAVYCSEIAGCDDCGGVGWVDCPRCDDDDAQTRLVDRRSAAQRAASELTWIEEGMGREVRTLQSEHFVVVWEIDKLRAGKRRLDGHELGHTYLARLEALFDDYRTVLEADPEEIDQRPTIFVWNEKEDQLRASERFCESESESAINRMGAVGRLSLCGVKPYYDDDEALHRAVAHYVVHLLASMQKPAGWVGDKRAGWLDAGFAHWMDDRLFGACETVCFHAHYFRQDIDARSWREHVKKLIARDKVPDFLTVLNQDTRTMTLEFHTVAFSLVDFLISKGGARFNTFFKRLRARSPTRDALFEVYQLSLDDFETAWRGWVEATY
jgi:hypothetical protein